MLLTSVEIQNYRSLEQVTLDDLRQFNVLIGHNNVGKSSVFGALMTVAQTLGNNLQLVLDPERVLTDQDIARALILAITLTPDATEREDFDEIADAGNAPALRVALKRSQFAIQLRCTFEAPVGQPGMLRLARVEIPAADGHWALIHQMDEPQGGWPTYQTTLSDLARLAQEARQAANPQYFFETHALDLRGTRFRVNFMLDNTRVDQATLFGPGVALGTWPIRQVNAYLSKSFFFSPFRHSTRRLSVVGTQNLAPDGTNLAQVLHTIGSRDRELFDAIEHFVQEALPDIGRLQVTLELGGQQTEVHFRAPASRALIPLHEMGGGVEQLLMVATVLHLTDSTCPLFLEEPESHLHPGAQRFLLGRLADDGRQVVLTTHSPTFLNTQQPTRVYRVMQTGGRTAVHSLAATDALGPILHDIGARKSDVLLSDAVLFVEGPSDAQVWEAWSNRLGRPLAEHNVTILSTGGGETAQGPRIRSEALEGLSDHAPVGHVIVLDRDERPAHEIARLQERLGRRVHVLERRELENYLLGPVW